MILKNKKQKDLIEELINSGPWKKTEDERVQMTISCQDSRDIPKVKNAGRIFKNNEINTQLMHNGLKVLAGGYHGEWMQEIIKKLKGHHEPQEEFAFFNILSKLDRNKDCTMIELGSFWSYYSLWFLKKFTKGSAIACEPDPNNIEIGIANSKINGLTERIKFINSAAGSLDGEQIEIPMDSNQLKSIKPIVRTVDSLIQEYGISYLDILHMDVQGAELNALEGAIESIRNGKIRFVFVSTHHYLFSRDPLTHKKCLDFLKTNGAHIITSHTVLESFSGDGLIVASFNEKDKDILISTSLNHTDDSLFRSSEEDLALAIKIANK